MSNEETQFDQQENRENMEQAAEPQEDAKAAAQPEEPASVAEEQASEPEEPVNEQADKQPQKPKKAEKPQKAAAPRMDAAKKLKIFKLVYYPALALFVALMFIFSAIDGVYGYSPDAYSDGYYTKVNAHICKLTENGPRSSMTDNAALIAAQDYIEETLKAGGFSYVEEDKPEVEKKGDKLVTVTDWATTSGVKEPTVTRHTTVPSAQLQKEMGTDTVLAGKTVTNIIAGIPSQKQNAKAIVISVRYDSRTDTAGAAENAAFVANVMQTLVELASSNKSFANDIIVVFAEELDSAYGTYCFFDTFTGFDGAASRARVGISLDAYGNSGTLALTDTSNAGYDYISAYTKVSGKVFNSSLVPGAMASELKSSGAVAAFGSVPALQVAVLGGLDSAQSSLDTAGEISQAIVHQQAQLVKDYIEGFGDSADTYCAVGSDDTAIFSYLDGGTVTYTATAAYVIGALIIALLAAAIALTFVKKTFPLKNMLIACGVELLTVLSTLVAMFGAYFLVTLMLTGFGVLPIHAITVVRYFNGGIFVAAMLVSLAAAFGFTTLYKKLFRVTSSDVVRGTALLFGAVGAIMCFASPAYSFLTAFLGMLMLGVLIASVCLHKKFKARFGFGMDRLYLYAIPVAICLPLVAAQITAVSRLLPLVLLPVTMMLFTGMLGVAVPYLDRTRAIFDRLAKKLPQRTIRVERTVTERVEDRAKRGKFTEQTFRRVQKEKVPVNYKNYFGISVLAVLGIVIALFSGGFGVDIDKSLTNYFSYNNAIYNDSLVYEWEKDTTGKISQRVVVGDLMAYKFLRASLEFDWNGELGRYERTVDTPADRVVGKEPELKKDGSSYIVSTFDGAVSYVTVRIPAASGITKITVKEKEQSANEDYEGYVYEFERQSSITLRLPYGFGDFVMEIDGSKPTRMYYEEYITVAHLGYNNHLDTLDEWNRIVSDYGDQKEGKALRGGIVIKKALDA